MIDTIPFLYEEFDINFELYITKPTSTALYHNVIRLTNTQSNQGSFGDRIVVFEVMGDLSKVNFISDAKPKRSQSVTHTATIPSERWVPIRIQQALLDGRFKIIFYFDSTPVGELLMDRPDVYNETKIFASETFRGRMPGFIKNLKLSTGKIKHID